MRENSERGKRLHSLDGHATEPPQHLVCQHRRLEILCQLKELQDLQLAGKNFIELNELEEVSQHRLGEQVRVRSKEVDDQGIGSAIGRKGSRGGLGSARVQRLENFPVGSSQGRGWVWEQLRDLLPRARGADGATLIDPIPQREHDFVSAKEGGMSFEDSIV
jgi:hypothetical protein